MLLHADGTRSHFERFRCDIHLQRDDDRPPEPPPPERAWTGPQDVLNWAGPQDPFATAGDAVGGRLIVRGVPNAAVTLALTPTLTANPNPNPNG